MSYEGGQNLRQANLALLIFASMNDFDALSHDNASSVIAEQLHADLMLDAS